jgi:hypothetical protein
MLPAAPGMLLLLLRALPEGCLLKLNISSRMSTGPGGGPLRPTVLSTYPELTPPPYDTTGSTAPLLLAAWACGPAAVTAAVEGWCDVLAWTWGAELGVCRVVTGALVMLPGSLCLLLLLSTPAADGWGAPGPALLLLLCLLMS